MIVWLSASDADEAWLGPVRTRVSVAGGRLAAAEGAALAARFDPMDFEDALELSLSLCSDGGALTHGARIGIATGDDAAGAARELADRAQTGEIVVDPDTHEAAADEYLFSGAVFHRGRRGMVLDGRYPRRQDCRALVKSLAAPPMPASRRELLDTLRAQVQRGDVRNVVLRAPDTTTARGWVQALAEEHPPRRLLHVGAAGSEEARPRALAPLGSLALALTRAHGHAAEHSAAIRDAFERVRHGDAVPRQTAIELCRALTAQGDSVWIAVDQPARIDGATLSVLAETLGTSGDNVVLWTLCRPGEQPLLAGPTRGESLDLSIEPLRLPERTAFAASILGLAEDSEVGRRVALLAGDTEEGIVEACKTLVASGDLVPGMNGFEWRVRPRGGQMPTPLDALVEERATGLPSHARRVLEILYTAPAGASIELAGRVAVLDGLDPNEFAPALEILMAEGWTADADTPSDAPGYARAAVREAMPPGRLSELNRFTAEALADAHGDEDAFRGATIAHHQVEGGNEQAAARSLLAAARAALGAHFERIAVRLAATALQLDNDDAIREQAQRIARQVDTTPPGPADAGEGQPPGRGLAGEAMQDAIRALQRGDHEAADRLIDTAVAAGWGRGAAQRLRTVSLLAQGQRSDAIRVFRSTLMRQRQGLRNPLTRSREAVTGALLRLQSGDAVGAVRTALTGLALSREIQDGRGEQACLHTIALCYTGLGRPDDATRLIASVTNRPAS